MHATLRKKILHSDYTFDFLLIGVSSHVKGYKFCGLLNQALHLDFERIEDYQIPKTEEDDISFSHYYCRQDEKGFVYRVIANRCENGWLIPERKHFDYYLLIEGNPAGADVDAILDKMKSINHILTASVEDASTLKSRKNLLFF
ncbi:MAG: IPExxxVDY family protein [Flavobacteriales bacterium]